MTETTGAAPGETPDSAPVKCALVDAGRIAYEAVPFTVMRTRYDALPEADRKDWQGIGGAVATAVIRAMAGTDPYADLADARAQLDSARAEAGRLLAALAEAGNRIDALTAERDGHRKRLAMLLADTPFEFRPGWEHEYDDVTPDDGLTGIPSEDEEDSPGYWRVRAALGTAVTALALVSVCDREGLAPQRGFTELAGMARDALAKVDGLAEDAAFLADAASLDETAPPAVVVATPTIQDGLVLRWYRNADVAKYGSDSALLSASRSGVMINGGSFLHDIPAIWTAHANRAHELLKAGRRDEAKAMATHEPGRAFRGEIVEIGR